MLFDILPIIVFFLTYKLSGIYMATALAIVVSLIQLIIYRLLKGKVERIQLMMLTLIIILGGATLVFHRPIFIKWKPTVVSWLFALLFLVSQWLGKKSMLERMIGEKVHLTKPIWRRLNMSWVLFFLMIGALNLYFAYYASTNTWVNFKLFGVLGLTFLFAVLQAIYLGKYREPPT